MSKLTFRYGAVSSAKSLNLLAVAHQVERQGKRVVVMKPTLDTRHGPTAVASRAGLEREADLLLDAGTALAADDYRDVDCILVDEAQFLTAFVVEQLRALTLTARVPVFAYGLRTDFRGHFFDGSRRLMELADSIEEVKTTCALCTRKAVFNQKLVDGRPVADDGPSIHLGGDERYRGVCHAHFVTASQ